MPTLYEMPLKEKMSDPGVYDMSSKPVEVVEAVEAPTPDAPKVQMKKPVKSKSAPPTAERKTLKLGKMKG